MPTIAEYARERKKAAEPVGGVSIAEYARQKKAAVEPHFQQWYARQSSRLGLDPNPDHPEHFYDYRAAYQAGAEPDESGHWPSQFKTEGHPRMIVDGVNTKTGEPAREMSIAEYARQRSAPVAPSDPNDEFEIVFGRPPVAEPPMQPIEFTPEMIALGKRAEGGKPADDPASVITGLRTALEAQPYSAFGQREGYFTIRNPQTGLPETEGRDWTDKEIADAKKFMRKYNEYFSSEHWTSLARAENAAHPIKALPKRIKTTIATALASPFHIGEGLMNTGLAWRVPGAKKFMRKYNEYFSSLDEGLAQESREYPGFEGIGTQAMGQIGSSVIEWFTLGKIFRALGWVEKVPRVAKATSAIKKVVGLEKLSQVSARAERVVSSTLGSMTKGVTAGTLTEALSQYNQGASLEEAAPHIIKSGVLLGSIAGGFNLAGSAETAVFIRKFRKTLVKAINQKYHRLYNELPAYQAPRPKEGPDWSAAKPSGRRRGTVEGVKSLKAMREAEMRKVDDIVSEVEAQLIQLKEGGLFKTGQGKIKDPVAMAEKLLKEGLQSGIVYPKGVKSLRKGLGRTQPFIDMPVTVADKIAFSRAGKKIDAIAEIAGKIPRPIKAARKYADKKLTAPKLPKAPSPKTPAPPVTKGKVEVYHAGKKGVLARGEPLSEKEIRDNIDELSREEAIVLLTDIDPNGTWTDADSKAEGEDPLTVQGARSALIDILERDPDNILTFQKSMRMRLPTAREVEAAVSQDKQDQIGIATQDLVPPAPSKAKPTTKKQPWEMTKAEYLQGKQGADEIAIATTAHTQHVKAAVKAGKPVPAEVLEAYKNNQWAKAALAKPTPTKAPPVVEPSKAKPGEWLDQIDTALAEGNVDEATAAMWNYIGTKQPLVKTATEGKVLEDYYSLQDKANENEWSDEKLEEVLEAEGMKGEKPSDLLITGSNKLQTLADGTKQAVFSVAKGNSAETALHETAEAYYKAQSSTWQKNTDKLVNQFLKDTGQSTKGAGYEKFAANSSAFNLSQDIAKKAGITGKKYWQRLHNIFKNVNRYFRKTVLPRVRSLRKAMGEKTLAPELQEKFAEPFKKTEAAPRQRTPKQPAKGEVALPPAAKESLPPESPYGKSETFELVKVKRQVLKNKGVKVNRIYKVSFSPKIAAKMKDGTFKIKTLKQARAINADRTRVKDWQAIYSGAATEKKWDGPILRSKAKVGKLVGIEVLQLTKGCQRALTTVERVENGVLPNENRIEACYGGTCWVNYTIPVKFKTLENMEVRDLSFADMDVVESRLKKPAWVARLNKSPFIREGYAGDSSHLFANGQAVQWLKMAKKYKVKPKTIFISAGYAPVTDANYEALIPYKDQFELHFSLSGWFDKNELMLRLGEFQKARELGLPAFGRIITNADKVSGIEMVNEKFLDAQLKKMGIKQKEILETPFHDDQSRKRSKPSGKWDYICCETHYCATCKWKCMTHLGAKANSDTSYSLQKRERKTIKESSLSEGPRARELHTDYILAGDDTYVTWRLVPQQTRTGEHYVLLGGGIGQADAVEKQFTKDVLSSEEFQGYPQADVISAENKLLTAIGRALGREFTDKPDVAQPLPKALYVITYKDFKGVDQRQKIWAATFIDKDKAISYQKAQQKEWGPDREYKVTKRTKPERIKEGLEDVVYAERTGGLVDIDLGVSTAEQYLNQFKEPLPSGITVGREPILALIGPFKANEIPTAISNIVADIDIHANKLLKSNLLEFRQVSSKLHGDDVKYSKYGKEKEETFSLQKREERVAAEGREGVIAQEEAVNILTKLGVTPLQTKLVGSYPRKRLTGERYGDIDVSVKLSKKDYDKLRNTTASYSPDIDITITDGKRIAAGVGISPSGHRVKWIQRKYPEVFDLTFPEPETFSLQKRERKKTTKQQIHETVKGPKEEVIRTPAQLLKYALRNQAKGAIKGFKAGRIEGVTIERLKAQERQAKAVAKEGERMIKKGYKRGFYQGQLDLKQTHKELTDFAKEHLPLSEQGKVMKAIANARTPAEIAYAAEAVNRILEAYDQRLANKEFKDMKKGLDLSHMRPEYRKKVQAILDEFTESTPSDKLLKRMLSLQRHLEITPDPDVPDRLVDKMRDTLARLERQPLNKMEADDIRGIIKTIQHLVHLNKTKNTIIVNKRKRNSKEVTGKATGELAARHKVKHEVRPGVYTKDPYQSLPLQIATWMQLSLDTKAFIMGGDGSIIQQVLFDGLRTGQRETVEQQKWAREQVQAILKKQGLDDYGKLSKWSSGINEKEAEILTMNLPTAVDPKGKRVHSIDMTRAQRVELYCVWQDPYSRSKLTRNAHQGLVFPQRLGPPVKAFPDDIRAILAEMSPEEVALGNDLVAYHNGESQRRFDKVWVAGHGYSIVDADKTHWPLTISSEHRKTDPDDILRDFESTQLDKRGIFKERKGGNEPVLIGDVFLKIMRYDNTVAAYMGKHSASNSAIRLLRDTEFRKQMRLRFAHGSQLLKDLEKTVREYRGLEVRVDEAYERLVRGMLARGHVGVLAAKPQIALYQTASFLTAATEIDLKYLAQFWNYRGPMNKQVTDEIRQWSAELEARMDGLATQIITPHQVGMNLRQYMTGSGSWWDEHKLGLIHKGDQTVVNNIWQAAKAEGKDKGLTGDELMEYTARRTEQIFDRTQPTWDVLTTSSLAREARHGAAAKVATLFSSQRSKNTNIVVRSTSEYNHSERTARDKAKWVKNLGIVIMIQGALIYLMQDMVFRGYRKAGEALGVDEWLTIDKKDSKAMKALKRGLLRLGSASGVLLGLPLQGLIQMGRGIFGLGKSKKTKPYKKGLVDHAFGVLDRIMGNWLIVGDLVATAYNAAKIGVQGRSDFFVGRRDDPLSDAINDLARAIRYFSKAADEAGESTGGRRRQRPKRPKRSKAG